MTAKEPADFLIFPNELQENQSINFICRANVGSPKGNIKIWKISQISNISEVIYVSNFTNQKAEFCPEVVNVNTSYTVTRDDNGAFFRCSSQNDLTPDPGPGKDSSKISVICMYKNNIFHFI